MYIEIRNVPIYRVNWLDDAAISKAAASLEVGQSGKFGGLTLNKLPDGIEICAQSKVSRLNAESAKMMGGMKK
jgi:hypothetical protein